MPTAAKLCDLYSFARNTGLSLSVTIRRKLPESYSRRKQIAEIMLAYEARKRDRRYLDYDDILDVVAHNLESSPRTRAWVGGHYDHLLVDEMQDTNPLQWKLLDPLKHYVTLFCVGDDAQSIYGFRGADFKNVHSFSERIEGSITLKLEKNYRSTQEILDASNWLLSLSPLNYGKQLVAARGSGKLLPRLHTFLNEWDEAHWITDDLLERRAAGADWRKHMILVRSAFAARIVESSLLASEIPYFFIGGTKLLQSAHVRDVLSVLRVVANPQDEIAWMRFLTLWDGVGEVTANKLIGGILEKETLDDGILSIRKNSKILDDAISVLTVVKQFQNQVPMAVKKAAMGMSDVLSYKYMNQDWEKRKKDFDLVEKLAEKHTSILAFIEDYLLDPVYVGQVDRTEDDDAVTIITIHSAKGTEREVCYIVNVSPGAFPIHYSIGNADEVEEERRVLYVALTRAINELIVTRHGFSLWAVTSPSTDNEGETEDNKPSSSYFFNTLPEGIFDETYHDRMSSISVDDIHGASDMPNVGIIID